MSIQTVRPRNQNWLLLKRILILAGMVYVFLWAVSGVRIDITRIQRGLPAIGRIIDAMFPPDWEMQSRALEGMMQSLYIAVIGTSIGSILAVPLGFLAARNVMVYQILSFVGKQLLSAIRTFPEIIIAIFFVAAYGPGPLAGLMAIGLHSIGMLGKLYADIIESIDKGPVEALQASGANAWEILLYAVFPQVLPEFVATSLYRFEINMRAASTLGLVGAGGIGVLLLQALQYRRWSVVGMALIVIVIVVTVIDYTSAYVRKRIV